MNNSIEPWKLTAYSLGELDAEETQKVRDAMESDPILQTELQELQSVIARVQSVLQKSPAEPSLTETQSTAINQQILNATVPTAKLDHTDIVQTRVSAASRNDDSNRNFRSRVWGLLTIAASILIGGILILSRYNAVELAQIDADKEKALIASQSKIPSLSKRLNPSGTIELRVQPIDELSDLSMTSPSTRERLESPTKKPENEWAINLGDDKGTIDPSRIERLPAIQPSPSTTTGTRGFALDGNDYVTPSDPQVSPTETSTAPQSVSVGVATLTSQPSSGPSAKVDELADSDAYRFTEGMKAVDDLPLVQIPIADSESGARPDVLAIVAADAAMGMGGRPNATLEKAVTEALEAKGYIKPLGDVQLEFVNELGLVVAKGTSPSPTGDRYEAIIESPFVVTEQSPLSTFSIDVDTASYSKIRQYLMQANQLPQPNAVRIEEMINYFEYDYAGPTDDHPFASNMAVQPCPWNEDHKLIRIGLQAKKIDVKERAKANLVFLLDVSGSMDEPNKLPLVKQAMSMLIRQLGENDRIAMVVYAGAAGCVLPSITGDRQAQILAALEDLNAGGSTNGGQGIELAYSIARDHFIPGGINRVILCTDGDFNVGTTSNEALIKLIQEQAKSKVFLTCLGFGMGNYNDSMMELITNQGNGVYGMIDNALEARRLMIEQLSGTLITVAKDVKIQVEFNPAKIASYRLIGYENRRLANEDFNNDKKDAGEIGAGHRVTALYEIVPVGVQKREPVVDELRYRAKAKKRSPSPPVPLPEDGEGGSGANGALPEGALSVAKDGKNEAVDDGSTNEWMTLKLRYKQPEADVSSKLEFFLTDESVEHSSDDSDFRWTNAVAEFGLLLRRSQQAPQADWGRMIERARSATGNDPYRIECLEMMTKARALSGK